MLTLSSPMLGNRFFGTPNQQKGNLNKMPDITTNKNSLTDSYTSDTPPPK